MKWLWVKVEPLEHEMNKELRLLCIIMKDSKGIVDTEENKRMGIAVLETAGMERGSTAQLDCSNFLPTTPRRRRFFGTGDAPPPTKIYRRAAADTMTSAQGDLYMLNMIKRRKYAVSQFQVRVASDLYRAIYVITSGGDGRTAIFIPTKITTLENISYISLAQPELKKLWM